MALKHAQALEPIDVQPLNERLPQSVSTSLIKSQMLQLMRVVLRAGEHLAEHHVRGEITLQCLEGQARVDTPERRITLSAGQLVLLPAGEAHAVQALTDTSLLVTVSLADAPGRVWP
jgi:quercetin dioxygenase-like cupin family protein